MKRTDKKIKHNRSFISAAVIIAALIITAFTGCGSAPAENERGADETEREIFAMDTVMYLKANGDNSEKAVDDAAAEIARLDELFSTENTKSEIYKLNESGTAEVSDETYALIKRAVEISDKTNGAFDISVYPVVSAWGFISKEYRVPDEEELAGLLQNVDYRKIGFDDGNNKITLPEGMKIDLGGIAKGYTAERIVGIFSDNGIESGIINLGGNAQVIGTKNDGSLWKVGIQEPSGDGVLGAVEVSDAAVVTSGGYERFFEEDGKRYHHIIDPATGRPAESGVVSATVITDDGTLADGLSTSLFIMGEKKAEDLWKNATEAFEFVIMDGSGKVYVTEGIADHFSSEYETEIVYK